VKSIIANFKPMNAHTIAPAKHLYKLITNHRHYRPDELLAYMVDDVLAGFGGKVGKAPPADTLDVLYELGQTYAKCVKFAEPFDDVLGTLYMELASTGGKKWLGQYFTPQPVADMMAMMLIGENRHETRADGSLWKACDPACGSGVMLLSMARAIHMSGDAGAMLRWSFTGVDIDSLVARIAATQMLANGLIHQAAMGELLVLHGNSLSTADMRVVVHATRRDLDAKHIAPALCEKRMKAIREAATGAGLQPGLFDGEEVGTHTKTPRAKQGGSRAQKSSEQRDVTTLPLFE
jgi:N-6 DNA Methylase